MLEHQPEALIAYEVRPMQDPTDIARAAIKAWREDHPVDPSALTVDDLPAEMMTPEVREQIAGMPDDVRALALFVGLAAATMTPAELKAVGITMVDQAECGDVR